VFGTDGGGSGGVGGGVNGGWLGNVTGVKSGDPIGESGGVGSGGGDASGVTSIVGGDVEIGWKVGDAPLLHAARTPSSSRITTPAIRPRTFAIQYIVQ
jgi:hypothetical protein